MHCCCLLEFAVDLATHARTIVEASRYVSSECLQHVWVANRCRLENWTGDMKGCQEMLLREKPVGPATGLHELCDLIVIRGEPTLEELLVADVLTRIASCLMVAIDERHGKGGEFTSMAHGLFIGQLEARRRALQLLGATRNATTPSHRRLEVLRGHCEQMADGLLEIMAQQGLTKRFYFDPERRFFKGSTNRRRQPSRWQSGAMAVALRCWMLGQAWTLGANPEWNRRYVASLSRLVSGECWHASQHWRSAQFAAYSLSLDGKVIVERDAATPPAATPANSPRQHRRF
jgi:hypothetical protein